MKIYRLKGNKRSLCYIFYLYKKGYESKSKIDQYLKYLKNSNLPNIKEEKLRLLHNQITVQEVSEAINQAKTSKSPGLSVLSAKYYKKLSEQLVIPLKDTMNEILRSGEIPESWK